MAPDELAQITPLLREYVEKSSTVTELHWDQIGSLRLPFDPYSSTQKEKIAHYFLLVSALDTAELVSSSENTRALIISLHNAMKEDLFKPDQVDKFESLVKETDKFYHLGRSKEKIPHVINSVNLFVEKSANGNLVDYAKRFAAPEEMVKQLENVPFMGKEHIDHSWMYLRWMVRPYPDLGVFSNFSPMQLKIPLTSFVRNVAFCLGTCSTLAANWDEPAKVEQERERLTEFALGLFPDDPAIVDYPFYVLGRWIKDEKMSLKLLKRHLKFWKKIFSTIQKPPISFDIASRNESTFENSVREELEKLQFMFNYEPHLFNLPIERGAPHYKPDFVLPRCRKNGKIVVLEPHGIWTPLEKRIVSLGESSFTIWVRPAEICLDEELFVNKIKVFREIYGDMYHLILIVQSSVKERVENDYPYIYDEIYDGADIPKLLYNLKNNTE